MSITASIVLYKNDIRVIKKTINSFFNSNLNVSLYLIDNSPTSELKILSTEYDNIEYCHIPNNIGFGSAHNIAIKKAMLDNTKYHFIINPDIEFSSDVIYEMVNFMKSNNTIGMVMPLIRNLDGSVQFLPKLIPTPLDILTRKLSRLFFSNNKFLDRYELRSLNCTRPTIIPILSGCFTLINLDFISKVGMYDERYFMYFEDWDLSRRMNRISKIYIFPKVSVFHGYESGANKSFRLFFIFIKSAILYFTKWGWFFDSERELVNKKILSEYYK